MKATGIVRRIDAGVIISLRSKTEENQGVPLILSKLSRWTLRLNWYGRDL